MTEKVIQLEGIDPIELYGSGNSNIGRISSKFPKLKVIARGSAIKVMGDANEIDRFDRRGHIGFARLDVRVFRVYLA